MAVVSVRRYDTSNLGHGRLDERGFLVVPSHPTRAGVFTYTLGDGTVVKELRPPDEVFSQESLDTLKAAPVTEGHPAEGVVTPENAGSLEIGIVGSDVRQDGEFVEAELHFRRQGAIQAVMDKELQELSCGYSCDIEATPGVFEGQRYDQVQRNIRYNHVAALPYGRARAGRGARIRLDSADGIAGSGDRAPEQNSKEANMAKWKLDGLEFEVPENLVPLAEKKMAELEVKATREKQRADEAEAKLAEATKALDEAKKRADEAEAPDVVDKRVRERLSLVERATKMAGELKCDGLSDREVMVAALGKAAPEMKLDDKSDQYVAAAFDLMGAEASRAADEDKKIDQAARSDERADEATASPIEAAWEARTKLGLLKENG